MILRSRKLESNNKQDVFPVNIFYLAAVDTSGKSYRKYVNETSYF